MPDQFNQWFSNNVRCPVCRHDIRSSISTTTSTTSTTSTNSTNNFAAAFNPVTNIVDQLTIDISNNELSDNLLSTIASRFLTNLLNPSATTSSNSTSTSTSTNARTNNDRIIYDPTTDALIFETIIRSNNHT